ncbi:MAG: hypothetical protein IJL26_10545 [Clostridia bacterium]|nr:hypothetical protein [Clostridia bacterium]
MYAALALRRFGILPSVWSDADACEKAFIIAVLNGEREAEGRERYG